PGLIAEDAAIVHPKSDAIRLCHTGSLYSERSPARLLAALDTALAACPEPVRQLRLLFAGPVDAEVASALTSYADRNDVAYLGILTRKESYSLQQSCDYCLLLEDPAASLKGVLTGKVFEYIGMRKHVIAFGISPESEVAGMLRRAGLLAFCGTDPASLATFLCELMHGRPQATMAPDETYI